MVKQTSLDAQSNFKLRPEYLKFAPPPIDYVEFPKRTFTEWKEIKSGSESNYYQG